MDHYPRKPRRNMLPATIAAMVVVGGLVAQVPTTHPHQLSAQTCDYVDTLLRELTRLDVPIDLTQSPGTFISTEYQREDLLDSITVDGVIPNKPANRDVQTAIANSEVLDVAINDVMAQVEVVDNATLQWIDQQNEALAPLHAQAIEATDHVEKIYC